MKILTKYAKNGYDYTIVKRENNLAIAVGRSRTCKAETWEVIEIQSHDGLKMGDTFMPPAEFAPSNNQWGTKGWTACNKEQAEDIFDRQKAAIKTSKLS
jgi:hypothetical protein